MKPLINRCRASGFVRFLYFILAAGLLVPTFLAISVTSYLRLGGDTIALRDSVLSAVTGTKRVVVNVGATTIGVARLVSGFFDLPEEARAGIGAARAAEVGVYQLDIPIPVNQRGAVLLRADKSMARRGWDRVVGVSQGQELVAVYFPHNGFSERKVRCCVLVVHERDLVVVAARANASGLMELVQKQMQHQGPLIPALAANF